MSEFSYFKGFPKLPKREGLPAMPVSWRLSNDAFGVNAEDIPQDQAVKLLTQAGLKQQLALVILMAGSGQSGTIKLLDAAGGPDKFLHYRPQARTCSSAS